MFYLRRTLFPVFLFVSACLVLAGCDASSTSASSTATPSDSTPAAGTGSATPSTSSATAVATVTWVTPNVAANSAAGLELLGFHIYYGTSPGALTHVADVADPTLTSYEIKNLASGMWYFAVSAYNADEAESPRSSTIGAVL